MKLQESINVNTYLTYKPPYNIEPDRKIVSESFDWDSNHPKTLAVICIQKLSENWRGYPKLEHFTAKDKDLFLQILDTQVPLQILVDNIKNDIFWKRCYKSRWTDSPLITNEKRITRSDMNCKRVKYILRGLSDSQNLETLDFSHCKISDEGAASIAKFILRHENLRSLILADNVFGPSGIESIAHALNHVTCSIRNLDLRLNTRLGSEGIAHIAVTIARGCNLTS
ncbi:uncharacterized protein LOC125241637 [Leguminivora glycinivorella]|uniref:uncharacterized protein LOC125241637 n=1 Tax=Leguminivora glycinivorella TaxID=1035111 RepID=UPI0020107B12|nr:uncharacterized protein LOC125241637 [Leguminivora glycinivorella]